MPGISPERRRPSRGAEDPRPPALRGTAPLSSFGARFRSRCPQYGHSVMYGLTSARQFLQTTNRSGVPAIKLSLRARRSGAARIYEVAQELLEVAVGVVDDALARRARAALDDVQDSR